MSKGYVKNSHRKLGKFDSSRHNGKGEKESTSVDKREKAASGKMKKSNKKEAKRESIYDKSE